MIRQSASITSVKYQENTNSMPRPMTYWPIDVVSSGRDRLAETNSPPQLKTAWDPPYRSSKYQNPQRRRLMDLSRAKQKRRLIQRRFHAMSPRLRPNISSTISERKRKNS